MADPRELPPSDDDLVRELLSLDPDAVVELVSALPTQAVPALMDLVGGEARETLPLGPLAQAQEIDSGYVPRPHLEYLSERLRLAVADVEEGTSRFLQVSMPPRMGKSQLSSVYLPVWLLRKHPDWKIGLISHSPTLAAGWGRSIRRLVENPDIPLGLRLARDAGAVADWQTTAGGGVISRSAPGQTITGEGFKVMIIDDPVKDFASAHSANYRKALWEWWIANARTRLEPPSLVVVVGCLTHETPVLMADGTEKPIRDVRPGEYVATYEGGRLTAAPVKNWANQGPDRIYALRLASGRVIRANGKHPFLVVDEKGVEAWRRTDELRTGERIRCDGGPGSELRAQLIRALRASAPRDSVSPTTTRSDGKTEPHETRRTKRDGRTFATVTRSTPRITRTSFVPKEERAQSVAVSRMIRTPGAVGFSLSTIATTPTSSGDSSATTATSSSDTAQQLPGSSQQPSISALTTDTIESITLDGTEDVFDIEVERTHNFVAAGLVTHNTRWHDDDMIGRLLSTEHEGDPGEWEQITFPAIAAEHDVLGREPGAPLLSPIVREETTDAALARWNDIERSVGSYTWSALYQQRPTSPRGAIFDTAWWRYWTTDPDLVTDDGSVILLPPDVRDGNGTWADSWDAAFKGTDDSDYVVGQRWCKYDGRFFLIAQQRGRWSFTETIARMKEWSYPSPVPPTNPFVTRRLIEDKANGTAIIDTLKNTIAGIEPVNPTASKEARARAVTPIPERGEVYLPHPDERSFTDASFVTDFIAELRDFPTGAHDDQVDSFSQAVSRLQDAGTMTLSIPRRSYRLSPENAQRAANARHSPTRSPASRTRAAIRRGNGR